MQGDLLCISVCHLIDTHVKQNRKHIFAAFIDFEKAFDSVWRDALLY